MNTWSRYDDVKDLTQGVRQADHPEILAALERWRLEDTGDPLLWAKYRRGAR